MYGVKIRIRRITEISPPDTFVECVFTDYDGQVHYFRDKLPVFTSEWEPQIPMRRRDPMFRDTNA